MHFFNIILEFMTDPEPMFAFFSLGVTNSSRKKNSLEILSPVLFLVILDQHLVVLVLALPLSESAAEDVDLLGRRRCSGCLGSGGDGL